MSANYLLSSVFGRSPIGPIQKHMAIVHRCASCLELLFEAAFASDWDKAASVHQSIIEQEHKADIIKKEVRLSLPKSLFLPVSRTDLLEIVSVQDKVANRAKDIAGIVVGRKMQVPASMQPAFQAFVQRSIAASQQAYRAMSELDELLETGFRGREVDRVEKMIDELNDIETQTDTDQIQVRQMLFRLESDLPPVDVIFLYKITDWVGDLADRASRVGNHLLLLLAQ
ncbi:hypothetical protein CI610_01917 [invertebrate metagenome]|uniref:TIGR00153 family protein n=1 Tax=invertebrate metagenome TaxID=1711999 RepID=A0A2H9T7E4_9ZZZZ